MENEEIWLPVKGFEGYYEVSNMGNIRRTKSKRLRAIEGNKSRVTIKADEEVISIIE